MRRQSKEALLVRAHLQYALEIAKVGACERAQVGCVLTPPDLSNPIGIGYNGPAAGLPNQCARPLEVGNCGCVHAEANAVIKAPRGPKWAFLTIPCCERCAGLLVNAEVECVVYAGPPHRDGLNAGVQLLDRLGIPHGTADEIIEMMANAVEDVPSSRSRFAEVWDDEDISAAKQQTSRFAD